MLPFLHMKNGLEGALGHIKEKGMPSTEQMRVEVEANDNRFRETIQIKLTEYTQLFNRFKEGEELTTEERTKMVNLSSELEELSRSLAKN
jgi:Ni/Co efflux regulator RcnB